MEAPASRGARGRSRVTALALAWVYLLVSDFLVSDFLVSDFLVSDFLVSDFLVSDFLPPHVSPFRHGLHWLEAVSTSLLAVTVWVGPRGRKPPGTSDQHTVA